MGVAWTEKARNDGSKSRAPKEGQHVEAAGGIEPPYGALQGQKRGSHRCVAVHTSSSGYVRVRTDSHSSEVCRGIYAV